MIPYFSGNKDTVTNHKSLTTNPILAKSKTYGT